MPAAGRERIGARPRRREGPWRTRMSSSSRRPPSTGKRGGACPLGRRGDARDLAAGTSFLPAGQPGAVLVDQSPPRPDLVRRLKAAVSDCGLLLLVNTYDLGEVIPLLQAGGAGGPPLARPA